MAARIGFDEMLQRTIQRTKQDETTARLVVETFLDEIYQSMKRGECVTLQNFGGFYVNPRQDTWVFKFNPSQKWKALFGWSSTYRGDL